MTRIKVELPLNFIFSTEIQVNIDDINYGGHLGHDRILTIMHEARIRFLNKYGMSEMDIDGYGIIISDVLINYKSQSYHGEILKIEIGIGSMTKKSCDFIYKITEKNSGREVARAKVGAVFFNYKKQKTVTIPKKFKKIFETHKF